MSQITSSLENVPIWQKTRKGNRWWRNRTSSEKRRRRSIWGGGEEAGVGPGSHRGADPQRRPLGVCGLTAPRPSGELALDRPSGPEN